MSRFNRKGWKTVMGRKPDGSLAPFPVKVGGSHDQRNQAAMKKYKKQQAAAFKEYKKNLKEAKKKVPLADRAKIKLTEMPEKYL